MLSMIEEAWGFGGSRVALCGKERESQTKPVAGLPVSWPQSQWETTLQEVINQSTRKTLLLRLTRHLQEVLLSYNPSLKCSMTEDRFSTAFSLDAHAVVTAQRNHCYLPW